MAVVARDLVGAVDAAYVDPGVAVAVVEQILVRMLCGVGGVIRRERGVDPGRAEPVAQVVKARLVHGALAVVAGVLRPGRVQVEDRAAVGEPMLGELAVRLGAT